MCSKQLNARIERLAVRIDYRKRNSKKQAKTKIKSSERSKREANENCDASVNMSSDAAALFAFKTGADDRNRRRMRSGEIYKKYDRLDSNDFSSYIILKRKMCKRKSKLQIQLKKLLIFNLHIKRLHLYTPFVTLTAVDPMRIPPSHFTTATNTNCTSV